MNSLSSRHKALAAHPVYETLGTVEGIRRFMCYHVFAVWDFMSLLKALQIKLTSVTVPWMPSPYPTEVVRLVNQIVLGEESDVDLQGRPVSHFDLYLEAMEEMGADTSMIQEFLRTQDFSLIPPGAREFVQHDLKTAQEGHVVEVAASFFFGREKLIPDMFNSIVDTLKREGICAPTFLYYLEKHIEVDAGEHGPLALRALSYLTGGDPQLEALAQESGKKALDMRVSLWDSVLQEAMPIVTV